MSISISSPSNSTLCSIDQCATPFDVHCFHCRLNMCSHHYFEHKQQSELTVENDDQMDDLLRLTSSRYFCISNNRFSLSKQRRTLTNPFVSSSYLLKKMRQRTARQRSTKTKTTTAAIKFYNLRQRTRKHQTTVKFCKRMLKTRLENNRLCNRKLPCPYHTVQ